MVGVFRMSVYDFYMLDSVVVNFFRCRVWTYATHMQRCTHQHTLLRTYESQKQTRYSLFFDFSWATFNPNVNVCILPYLFETHTNAHTNISVIVLEPYEKLNRHSICVKQHHYQQFAGWAVRLCCLLETLLLLLSFGYAIRVLFAMAWSSRSAVSWWKSIERSKSTPLSARQSQIFTQKING